MNEPHGGNVWKYEGCLDFSANLNPLGMPGAVRQTVIENAGLWDRYPDPDCQELTERLAVREGLSPGQIVCGNGADDVLWRIVQALRPARALIAVPCFSEYQRSLESIGCTVETISLDPKNGFVLPKTFVNALHPGLDLVILCHPNNPTGRLIPPTLLKTISCICEQNGIRLLLDECFLELTEAGAARSAKPFVPAHLIRLNAFTKTFAMPGLRLGYAVFGDTELAERVRRTGQYWSVSVPAQVAGIAAAEERGYLSKARQVIAEEKEFLMTALQDLSVKVYPSDANFILFQARAGLFRDLQKERILVRSCENFAGLDDTYYRIAVRPHFENERLIEALRRCL